MKLGNKITKIISIDSEQFKIKLEFKDEVAGTVDLGHIFNKPRNLALEIIRGDFFSKCYIESGNLAWPNGLELCPDNLRMNLIQVKKKKSAA